MKHIHTLLAFLISTAAGAQLVNGSFEADGAADLSGWSSTCGTMSSSPDVPGETGNWSIRLEQVDHWTCTHDYVYQYLPFAHCGDVWELGVWARTDPSAQLGMSISFMTRDGGVWGAGGPWPRFVRRQKNRRCQRRRVCRSGRCVHPGACFQKQVRTLAIATLAIATLAIGTLAIVTLAIATLAIGTLAIGTLAIGTRQTTKVEFLIHENL